MANIKGGKRADILVGTSRDDRIQGLGGDDQLYGLEGDDLLEGGNGNDLLVGGAGSDTLNGGNGIDTIDYSGWTGSIRVDASGYSTDTNGMGSVREHGPDGTLLSTDQYSYIENVIGSAGDDYIAMTGGSNSIWGGDGNDWIHGGNGDDWLYGGAGNDLIDIANGNDYADGGDGIDTLFWAYGGLLDAVVDLAAGRVDYPRYGSDNWDIVLNFENVRGSYGNKQIFGTDGPNIVQAGDGSDLIDGRGGDDVLVGDFGRRLEGYYSTPFGFDDDIRGGDGDDLISGDYGNNVLTGGSGADTFVFDITGSENRITDFEDGIDMVALYGGLSITGWELRDSDGDGIGDSQAALVSNGTSILFEGHADVPASLLDGTALTLSTDAFAIPELTLWG